MMMYRCCADCGGVVTIDWATGKWICDNCGRQHD